jgi:hypothetical protein
MKKLDVLWRLFERCMIGKDYVTFKTQFDEIFRCGGMEALAKFIIQNLWVYDLEYPTDPDAEYLRGMMKELWETGCWPKDGE